MSRSSDEQRTQIEDEDAAKETRRGEDTHRVRGKGGVLPVAEATEFLLCGPSSVEQSVALPTLEVRLSSLGSSFLSFAPSPNLSL